MWNLHKNKNIEKDLSKAQGWHMIKHEYAIWQKKTVLFTSATEVSG